MVTEEKNMSQIDFSEVPSAKNMTFGIVVSDYHSEITYSMRDAAIEVLKKQGAQDKNIIIKYVPGSYELIYGAYLFAEYSEVNAIICIGCIIKGETKHYEFISHTVANKIAQIGIDYGIPVIFGVITPDNMEQARERAGGKYGNKGAEAAIAAIKMAALDEAMQVEFS